MALPIDYGYYLFRVCRGKGTGALGGDGWVVGGGGMKRRGGEVPNPLHH